MRGRNFPLYYLPVGFALFCLIFPNRFQYFISLIIAFILFLSASNLGKRLLSSRLEDEPFYFPFGLGVILLAGYLLFSFSTASFAIYSFLIVLALLAVLEIRLMTHPIPFCLLWIAPAVIVGFWSCLTPITFFDALVYHLGLPHQYMAAGRMLLLPHHLYTSFPPFDQVLNLLFAGTGANSGIKIFSMIILISLLWIAHRYLERTLKEPIRILRLVLPLLLIPSVWILVHLVSADLLTAMFFCAGVFLLLLHPPKLRLQMIAAVLIAFSVWTKSNVLLFTPLLFFLWRWKPFWENLRLLSAFFGLIILFIFPLFIRNYLGFGDPLYPALSKHISNTNWSEQQEEALRKDSFPRRAQNFVGSITVPFRLILRPNEFGSASEIGYIPLLSLLLYPLAARSQLNRILIYVVVCFVAWFVIFPNFRQFIPVFFLLIPVFYSAWNTLMNRSRLLYAAAFMLCAIYSLSILYPFYRRYFPLISIHETEKEYLRKKVDYYRVAEFANRMQDRGMLIGETRSAYFRVPVTVSSAYDRNPFLDLLHNSPDADALHRQLNQKGISFLVINRSEFNRMARKYGLWKLESHEMKRMQEFLKQFVIPKYRNGEVYYLELK